MTLGYMPQQSSEIWEYELPVGFVLFWVFFSIYVLKSSTALNFRFLIYKQVSTKFLMQFYELPEETVKQSSKRDLFFGSPFSR